MLDQLTLWLFDSALLLVPDYKKYMFKVSPFNSSKQEKCQKKEIVIKKGQVEWWFFDKFPLINILLGQSLQKLSSKMQNGR